MADPVNFMMLLGEDDSNDLKVMKEVLKNIDYQGSMHHIALGQDIVDWMLKQGKYDQGKHTLPDLILLDIGLPGVDGKQILKTLRENDSTKTIPIIMMSGSVSQRDYHDCIALGCNAYIQKSADLMAFTAACRLFIEGWQQLVQQEFY